MRLTALRKSSKETTKHPTNTKHPERLPRSPYFPSPPLFCDSGLALSTKGKNVRAEQHGARCDRNTLHNLAYPISLFHTPTKVGTRTCLNISLSPTTNHKPVPQVSQLTRSQSLTETYSSGKPCGRTQSLDRRRAENANPHPLTGRRDRKSVV